MLYEKQNAIRVAKQFIEEVRKLESKFSFSFNSDSGDIYLSYRTAEKGKVWDKISIDWIDTKLSVTEKTNAEIIDEALSKLTEEERKALGF